LDEVKLTRPQGGEAHLMKRVPSVSGVLSDRLVEIEKGWKEGS